MKRQMMFWSKDMLDGEYILILILYSYFYFFEVRDISCRGYQFLFSLFLYRSKST